MNWLANNLDTVAELTIRHLLLALPPILASFVVAIPIGWAAHRWRIVRGPALVISGLLYAIPSLPLLLVLPVIFGVGVRTDANIIIALTLYGVALMARTVADAFDAVDRTVVQSATAIGYGPWRRFFVVEFPLAGPVLLAGLRVVAVSTISLLTVGSVIGISTLGSLFTDGLQRNIPLEIATGIILTIALALLVDGLLVLLGRLLLPWSRPAKAAGRARRVAEAVGA